MRRVPAATSSAESSPNTPCTPVRSCVLTSRLPGRWLRMNAQRQWQERSVSGVVVVVTQPLTPQGRSPGRTQT